MLENVLIAGIATFIVFISVETIKSFRQFLIFKRVRETILIAAFGYLKHTPKGFVDLSRLKTHLIEKLREIKLIRWVKDITITWESVDAIQFVFELKFEKLQPKYKFVIGLKDVDEVINRTQ
ncbi:MAG: hypothetical protein BGO41_02800 [Clostridiales bacterium 38-18]|nr:MAG: hypothetical protein BGO41_02800 [Clostridiales bacterium 38-18]